MLPEHIDEDGRYQVLADETRGLYLLLVTADMLERPVPFTPLWAIPCGDYETYLALRRWLSVRRDRWQGWGELAEALGHEAFDRHMRALIGAEPLQHAIATVVQNTHDPLELLLGEQVESVAGRGVEILYRHRFASADARAGFDRWFGTRRNFLAVEELLKVGYARGTRALGALLDELAAQPTPKRQRRRGRRHARAAA